MQILSQLRAVFRPLCKVTAFAGAALITGAASANEPGQTATFIGMCDASAAAAVDDSRLIVADDEDNILRVYHRSGGEALATFDMSAFLGVQGKKKAKEADFEAAAQLGNVVFWITSHGRNSKGAEKAERQRLFATTVEASGDKVVISPTGKPYRSLLDDLVSEPQLAPYRLEEASKLAPKAAGGFNIEGLAATPDGRLLIGFRSPVRDGKTLVVPLLNPMDTIQGTKAKFGKPMELQLEGLGIRALERVGEKFLIIAGSTGTGSVPTKLFEWDGKEQPKAIPTDATAGLNPEGIAFQTKDGAVEYLLLSDDGERLVEGQACKDLKDPKMKTFRARIVRF